ncbi:MAG: hypothetical protein R3C09_08125 [Pirellulaceae bacterium]
MSDPIMDILDDFDRRWRIGERPDLAPLIEHLRAQGDDELCVELCAADLEWLARPSAQTILALSFPLQRNQPFPHSRNFAQRAQHFADHPPHPDQHPKNTGPLAIEYASLLDNLLRDHRYCQRMLEAEFLARSQWGDAPDIDAFLAESRGLGLPYANASETSDCSSANLLDTQQVAGVLTAQLDHLAQFRVSVIRADKLLLSVRVPPQFEIGRQNRREPSPPVWLPETNRLVVANVADRNLSCHQIHIRCTRIHEVALTNTSRNVALSLESAPLRPTETTHLPTPVTVTINDLVVEINTEA